MSEHGWSPEPLDREKLEQILRRFRIPGQVLEFRRLTSGHINTAYCVRCQSGTEEKEYLVQALNWYVFPEPETVMRNIDLLTGHIQAKEPGGERRRRLHFHHTAEGENYLSLGEGDAREFWRVSNFIEDAVSFESGEGGAELLRMAGNAFGHFEALLQDFEPAQLEETIAHFHDTRWRLEQLRQRAREDPAGRTGEVQAELEEIFSWEEYACSLCDAVARGELPLRVTHNDTKTNNVLFDRDTLEPLVVIDLDTCMPGLACYDFGDAIRFAAGKGKESGSRPEEMQLDPELFHAFAEGYFSETAAFLTGLELDSMADGVCIITLELAARFLEDYLNGDKYFRISYPEHNLVRTRSQLALFRDFRKHREEMNRMVQEIAAKYR